MSRVTRTSPDDPRLAAYMNVREKDLVGREGRFIAEGMNVVRVLVSPRSLYEAESLLLSEKREDAIAELGVPENVPVYSLAQADMDKLTGFHIHRGVLAVGVRPPEKEGVSQHMAAGARLVVALMGIVNHDNVGGIFRNAAAFGADLIVMDHVSCDPLYRKAIRVSVGGALTVPMRRFESAEAMLEWLQNAHFNVLALSPRGRERMADVRREPDERTAVLLGPEGPGLPEELLARLRTVRIPMSPEFDSLNVSVTSGIALSVLGARPTW